MLILTSGSYKLFILKLLVPILDSDWLIGVVNDTIYLQLESVHIKPRCVLSFHRELEKGALDFSLKPCRAGLQSTARAHRTVSE